MWNIGKDKYGVGPGIDNFLKNIITKKEAAKNIAIDKSAIQEQIDYVKAKIAGERKGF